MSGRSLSTDNLINSVRTRAMLPSTQNTFSEQDFLMFANEEMDLGIVPHILSYHEDYLLDTKSITLTDSLRYKIPDRAIGNKLLDVRYRDNSNNLYEMTRIFKEDESYFQSGQRGPSLLRPFLVEADEIVLPEGTLPTGGGYLEMMYFLRPNLIVSEDRVCRVKTIDTNTNTVVIDRYPAAFVNATKFDITSSKSPFKLVAMEIEPTVLANSNTLTFTFSQLPKHLNIGDVIAIPEETVIPQVPVELHSMLAQRIAIRCLEALGDTTGLQNAMVKLQEMETKTGSLIDDRVEGAPRKIINFHSTLRQQNKWTRR